MLLIGSVNLSTNSLESNWESFVVIKTKSAPSDFLKVFDALWEKGVQLTEERLADYREQASASRSGDYYVP